MSETRLIKNTGGEPVRCAWPEGTFIQGGHPSWREPGDDTFVEAFPPDGGFFRGDASTLENAEQIAFAKYRRSVECAEHVWDARGYTNGGAFCTKCGLFGSKVFTGADLGQFCHTCGVGTTWGRYSLVATWDEQRHRVINPGPDEEHVWFCETHAPFRAEWRAYMDALRGVEVTEEDIAAVLTNLSQRGKDE